MNTFDLDKFNRPIDSPVTNNINAPYQGGMDFDSQTDRNIIDNTKLRNFNFNAGTGGTIVLGGVSNGNGVLLVKDSGGTTKVTANNTGIEITDGKLTFVNTAGGTVLDVIGLNSVTSFNSANVSSIVVGTQSSTSYVAVTGGTLTTLVLSRPTKVFQYIDVFARNPDFINFAKFEIFDSFDSSQLNELSIYGTYFTYVDWDSGTGLINDVLYYSKGQEAYSGNILTLAAGTHTLSLRARAEYAGSAVWEFFDIGYIQLGV